MELSKRISTAREYAEMDIEEASKKLSVEPETITAWESGAIEPSLADLQKMCAVYGVSSDFLLLGNDPDGKYLLKQCPDCKTQIPKGGAFCPSCGRPIDGEESTSQQIQISQPQDTLCTIVLSLGIGEIERASNGVRKFYQDPAYWRGCICPDGRNCGDCTEQEREHLINSISAQLKQGTPTLLCRSIPYSVAEGVISFFHDRANAFLFYDSDGSTVEELIRATPKIKYILGDPQTVDHAEGKQSIQEKTGFSYRRATKILLLLAMVCFAFPFVTVSCMDQKASLNGFEVATKILLDDEKSNLVETAENDIYAALDKENSSDLEIYARYLGFLPNLFVFFAFSSAISGLYRGWNAKRYTREKRWGLLADVVTGFAGLILFRVTFVPYYGLENILDYIDIDFETGWLLALFLYFCAALTAYMSKAEIVAHKADKEEDRKENVIGIIINSSMIIVFIGLILMITYKKPIGKDGEPLPTWNTDINIGGESLNQSSSNSPITPDESQVTVPPPVAPSAVFNSGVFGTNPSVELTVNGDYVSYSVYMGFDGGQVAGIEGTAPLSNEISFTGNDGWDNIVEGKIYYIADDTVAVESRTVKEAEYGLGYSLDIKYTQLKRQEKPLAFYPEAAYDGMPTFSRSKFIDIDTSAFCEAYEGNRVRIYGLSFFDGTYDSNTRVLVDDDHSVVLMDMTIDDIPDGFGSDVVVEGYVTGYRDYGDFYALCLDNTEVSIWLTDYWVDGNYGTSD